MGAHLIECSGNADPDNFGLMSVAEWDGVPLTQVLAALGVSRPARTRCWSRAWTTPRSRSRTSNPGASWVFPLDALERLGAFLAVRMNGEPLTADHGAPVRLVVPGWYGCSWIKWVNELRDRRRRRTDDDADDGVLAAHASGQHPEAREGLRAAGHRSRGDADPRREAPRRRPPPIPHHRHRLGRRSPGRSARDPLQRQRDAAAPSRSVPPRARNATWSLWDYRWRPASPGIYNIALHAADPSIRTRRLDVSYYVRRVVIDEV